MGEGGATYRLVLLEEPPSLSPGYDDGLCRHVGIGDGSAHQHGHMILQVDMQVLLITKDNLGWPQFSSGSVGMNEKFYSRF